MENERKEDLREIAKSLNRIEELLRPISEINVILLKKQKDYDERKNKSGYIGEKNG